MSFMENTTNNNIENIEKTPERAKGESSDRRSFCWSFVKDRNDRLKKAKRLAAKDAVIYTLVLLAVFALLCVGVGVAVYFGTV